MDAILARGESGSASSESPASRCEAVVRQNGWASTGDSAEALMCGQGYSRITLERDVSSRRALYRSTQASGVQSVTPHRSVPDRCTGRALWANR